VLKWHRPNIFSLLMERQRRIHDETHGLARGSGTGADSAWSSLEWHYERNGRCEPPTPPIRHPGGPTGGGGGPDGQTPHEQVPAVQHGLNNELADGMYAGGRDTSLSSSTATASMAGGSIGCTYWLVGVDECVTLVAISRGGGNAAAGDACDSGGVTSSLLQLVHMLWLLPEFSMLSNIL
jgi:hypothetical protein